MLSLFSRASTDLEIDRKPRRRLRRAGQGAARRRVLLPNLEMLETRITPSTFTWTGAALVNGAPDPSWSNSDNWTSNVSGDPQSGDAVIFPPGVSSTSSNNDLSGLQLASRSKTAATASPAIKLCSTPSRR